MDPRLMPPMQDNRLGSLFISREGTNLARVDPLKRMFRKLFNLIHLSTRGHVVAIVGEFLGTLIFVILASAGAESAGASSNENKGDSVSTAPSVTSPALLLYAAVATGFSLAITSWTFFRISGGLFNPVISFGMALIGVITWARCALLIARQPIATVAASYIVYGVFNGGLNTATTLGNAFVIFMLAAEQHAATYLAPLGIGLFWTGASLNPIRSLAPCMVSHSFTSYHWIHWIGPISGVILAVLIYKLVKALEYESVNGEDHDIPLDLLPRLSPSRKPSSVVAHASTHSGYESVRALTPEPASLKPISRQHTVNASPRTGSYTAKPAPTIAQNTE
ncbi:related to aquaporin [Rhynchosporium graminicola]|uniref:Related to aquaporin n=1 Tax=Rhynchosporium graminicola TaxID=2792576 RepID=A0A1E1KVR0_9HELO|nr:related to aquaporin [Rhynchosporium commune]